MPEEVMERLLPDGIGPSAEVEKATLHEMQSVLRQRTTLAVLAMMSAALVLPCLPESAAWHLAAMKKGGVWLAAALCLCSLTFCGMFIRMSARLRALGLGRTRGSWGRFAWETAGSFVGFVIAATICAASGWYLDNYGTGGLPGIIVAAWLGIRLRQVPTYSQIKSDVAEDLRPPSIK